MKQKIVFLEGIRGVAAMIVVIAHFVQVFLPAGFSADPTLSRTKYEGLLRATPFNLFYNGSFAVAIFFILSGYVLSYRYFQTYNEQSVISMAKKRYPRLAIPALVSVLLAFIITECDLIFLDSLSAHTHFISGNPYASDTTWWEVIKLSLLSNFFYFKSVYNPVLWTMTYELFGSFLVFSCLLLFGKTKFRFIVYAALIAYFFKSFFLAFVIGMMISDIHQRPLLTWKPSRLSINMMFLLLLAGAGVYFGSYPYGGVKDTIYEGTHVFENLKFLEVHYFVFYHIMGAALLFIVILQSTVLQKLFSFSWFEYLGKISFSLYLVHFCIISSFSSFLFIQFHAFCSYGVSFLLTFVCTLPVLWGLSHLVYTWVDQKTVQLLSRPNKKNPSLSEPITQKG